MAIPELAQDALDLTASLINEFGPRLTTTPPCTKTANALHSHFQSSCDRAEFEDFVTQPNGPIYFLRWMCVLFYISLVFLWLRLPIIALVCAWASVGILVFEYLLYYEVIDRFSPDGTARNVYGVIEPVGEVKNIVIFSGHHDSAHIFNFISNSPETYMVRVAAFLLVVFGDWIYLIVATWKCLAGGHIWQEWTRVDWTFAVLLTVGIAAVRPMWDFVNDEGTPGAGDNLISSSMAVILSRYYGSREKLKNTRLVFLSYDAEESCLRGSRAFFKRHKKEYNDTKTWNFNVDIPYCVHDLKFLTSDINGLVRLSSRMAKRLVGIAHDLGYDKAQAIGIMFLAGATDAAEAALAGIEATSLVGLPYYSPTDAHGKRLVYHTPKDTVDSIEPEMVQATLRVFMKFVDEIDNGEFP
jgi:hypothetical protein